MTDGSLHESTSPDGPPLAALPDDAILLHIGVHKTGTTALQARVNASRAELAEYGVTYPGPWEAQHQPSMSLVHAVWAWGPRDLKADAAKWAAFAAETRAIEGKVLISTEFLCEANDEEARTAVETLGADRVHVVVGFRHMAELLPSSWQQYLKTGRSITYEDWLRQALEGPSVPLITPSFWKRNDLPVVLRRWVDLLGPERVTVVIADGDRQRLGRVVSELLGMPSTMFDERRPNEKTRSNRSMTAEEAEFIRRTNEFARENKGIPAERYTHLMRNGALRQMVENRQPTPAETKLGIPPWAEARVLEIANEHVAAIKASGVRVVGDVNSLNAPITTRELTTPDWVPLDAASDAVIGVLRQSNTYDDRSTGLRNYTARQMADELKRRVRQRVKRLIKR